MDIKKTILTLAGIALVAACLPVPVRGADEGERSAVSEDELFARFAEEVMSSAQAGPWDDPRPYVASSASDALRRDAESYAADYGVPLEEAIRRLELQQTIGELNATLTANERGTFAGLWIQHTPDYRVVVRFTRDGARTSQAYVESSPLSGLVEVRGARLTLAELRAAQEQAMRWIRDQGIPAESGIDLSENRVELYVTEPVGLHAALQNARQELPDGVEIIRVDELSRPVTDVYGGLELVYCEPTSCELSTSGYPVRRDSDGTLGITAAGHASNSLSYAGAALTFMQENNSAGHDIQWHTSTSLTVVPWFNDGLFGSPVGRPKYRSFQNVGDYVCKFGRKTGRGCGEITDTTVNINGSATSIRVHNTNNTVLAESGDSGGPCFLGDRPYGTITNRYLPYDVVYMPIDYVADLGVDVYVDWCWVYDTNGTPGIQRDEATQATLDFFATEIPRWGARYVVICYFSTP